MLSRPFWQKLETTRVAGGKQWTHQEDLVIQPNKMKISKNPQLANDLGEALYPKIKLALEEGCETMAEIGWNLKAVTAGKITGMFLEGLEEAELRNLIQNDKALGEKMAEAVEAIVEFERRRAAGGRA